MTDIAMELQRLNPTEMRTADDGCTTFLWYENAARFVEVDVHTSGELCWNARIGTNTQFGESATRDGVPRFLRHCIEQVVQ